jgi:5-bromo-4-chloroindolyl phosphate hydrolysis protein
MFKWFVKQQPKIICQDENYFSPGDKIVELEEKVKLLENQVKELQQEMVETFVAIYETANSLDARIDILASEPYKLPSNAEEIK